ncbi:MAG TPA: sulfite exporter TauE/SafE family protein [Candidatus Caccopulliclostridium gallistercoris]|uniref:Probable membrane transporter protein n=1 Tax=Candidatus Caccopulliclostridium gallistercoris TaxID=2840719 RepID=A0A9D1NEM7_9FIRM|nr:sulfite exporter TauE/SafE family protein [Candidatus Caccopulliclostridium gallistercoris]
MTIFLLILFGVIGGIFGGMGMGGGTMLIPLLTIFLNFSQKVSQGFNIFSFLVMAVFALIIHIKNGLVDIKSVIPIVLSGILFSLGGAYLANLVKGNVLKIIFGVFLILLAIFEIFKLFKENKTKN